MVRSPFWVCQRLITLAIGHWPVLHGEAVWSGVDLLGLPLDAFCDAVYAWAVREATAEQRRRFDHALADPPAGASVTETDQAWDDGTESAEFLVAMRAHNIDGHM